MTVRPLGISIAYFHLQPIGISFISTRAPSSPPSFSLSAAGEAYFRHMHFRSGAFAALTFICIVNFAQTLDHVGMDPSFKFAWLQDKREPDSEEES